MKRLHVACVAVAVSCVASAAQAALIHRYSFNDATANDSVGTLDGKLANEASIANGVLNINRSTNDYVDMGTGLAFTSSFSIETWVRTSPGDTSWLGVVSRHLQGYENGYFLIIN